MNPKRRKELKKLLKEAKIEQSKSKTLIYQKWIEKTERKLKEKK